MERYPFLAVLLFPFFASSCSLTPFPLYPFLVSGSPPQIQLEGLGSVVGSTSSFDIPCHTVPLAALVSPLLVTTRRCCERLGICDYVLLTET